MINTKAGELTLKGSKAELIADLAVIVRGIKEAIMEDGKETEESVKQEIDEAVKIGLMNEEEFKTIQKEKIKEVVKTLFDDLLGGLFDEDK
jgi:formyltetrahydrofolate synthetase